jgi:hypothetical protein
MMSLEQRIEAFVRLGERLGNLTIEEKEELFWRVNNSNAWFTPQNIEHAIQGLQLFLDKNALVNWTASYPTLSNYTNSKKIGIIMAGNIPAVGFHDLLCVLISGHEAHVKLSSSDTVFTSWIIRELIHINPEFQKIIHIEDLLKGKDAYIATGSDNSARYFDYYFGKYPHVIRKNRTSVAVLNGKESIDDLKLLGTDCFQYFGLGCRNISKLYVQSEKQLIQFLDAIQDFSIELNHHKYVNNYDYNKSIYLVNKVPHLDNGFVLLKESDQLVSPISVLHYEFYENEETLLQKLELLNDKIQCVVSKEAWFSTSFSFGTAQCPALGEYADGVDTLEFLLNL